MGIEHILDCDPDEYVVMYSWTRAYPMRKDHPAGQNHLSLLGVHYDSVFGHWVPVTLTCPRVEGEKFFVGLNRHYNELHIWDGKIQLIPCDNVNVYKVGKKVTNKNQDRRRYWDQYVKGWILKWYNEAMIVSLSEYDVDFDKKALRRFKMT